MSCVDIKISENLLSICVLVNRLDANTAREFKRECEAVWSPAINAISIDLAQVEFIDSSGVGALLGINKKLPPNSPGVRLSGMRPPVQAVIELLRLHRIFEIEG